MFCIISDEMVDYSFCKPNKKWNEHFLVRDMEQNSTGTWRKESQQKEKVSAYKTIPDQKIHHPTL